MLRLSPACSRWAALLILGFPAAALCQSSAASASGVRNACEFPGADAGEKIIRAIAALPPGGGTVDARCLQGQQVINSSLFAGAAERPVTLLLGAADYRLNAKQAMTNGSRIIGIGRGNGNLGTHISNGNISNDAMFLLGAANPSFAVQIEALHMHCGASLRPGAPGYRVTGVLNLYCQERCWVRDVGMYSCNESALAVHSYSAQNSGPYSDIDILMDPVNSLRGTTCVSVYKVPAFRGLQNITCNSSGLKIRPAIGIGFGAANGVAENIHCEGTLVDCINLGDAGEGHGDTGVVAFDVRNVYGVFQTGMTNLVHITAKTRAVCLSGLVRGNAENAFTDDTVNPPYHNHAVDLGLYCIGSEGQGRSRISTDSDVPNMMADGWVAGKTNSASVSSDGTFVPAQYSCRTLSPKPNGALVFCSDCAPARTPCTCGGPGALAVRQGGLWSCK